MSILINKGQLPNKKIRFNLYFSCFTLSALYCFTCNFEPAVLPAIVGTVKRSPTKYSPLYDECMQLTNSSMDEQGKAVGTKQKNDIRTASQLDSLQCLVMSLEMLKLFVSLYKGC